MHLLQMDAVGDLHYTLMGKQDNTAQLNVHSFCPKGKTLSFSGHFYWFNCWWRVLSLQH